MPVKRNENTFPDFKGSSYCRREELNGYRDDPNIHVIDRNGLADPLIARMPLEDLQDWRISYFHHIIPDGYEDTLASGTNQI